MDQTHKFRVVAWWSAGRTGLAKSDSAPNAIHFTAPITFGGLEGRWTPEDLLLGALAGSFTTTFRALAEHSTFEYIDLEMDVEGVVMREGAIYNFTRISIRANLMITNEDERGTGLKLLHQTKDVCLVALALSIPQTFEAAVSVAAPALIGSTNGKAQR